MSTPPQTATLLDDYHRHIGRKVFVLLVLLALTVIALMLSLTLGAADLSVTKVAQSLVGGDVPHRVELIVWNIRLPQALAALVAGAGLALAGTAMQAILRNPLGSPFTLGISHAAAFGAALSVMFLGSGSMDSSHEVAVNVTGPLTTTAAAFLCSLLATSVIMGVSHLRGAGPEVMVLTGVALGALFTAGTMLLQFLADDVQLAAMVFWTFGDTSRASWNELGVIALVTVLAGIYFLSRSGEYNALDAGEDTARGLGVHVGRVRLVGMLVASLVTAVIIAFLGIIGFVGLVVPHMLRGRLGGDHRYLLPGVILAGGLLLLAADTVARLVLQPHLLPVSVLTAFLGAPTFLYLILRRKDT